MYIVWSFGRLRFRHEALLTVSADELKSRLNSLQPSEALVALDAFSRQTGWSSAGLLEAFLENFMSQLQQLPRAALPQILSICARMYHRQQIRVDDRWIQRLLFHILRGVQMFSASELGQVRFAANSV